MGKFLAAFLCFCAGFTPLHGQRLLIRQPVDGYRAEEGLVAEFVRAPELPCKVNSKNKRLDGCFELYAIIPPPQSAARRSLT